MRHAFVISTHFRCLVECAFVGAPPFLFVHVDLMNLHDSKRRSQMNGTNRWHLRSSLMFIEIIFGKIQFASISNANQNHGNERCGRVSFYWLSTDLIRDEPLMMPTPESSR